MREVELTAGRFGQGPLRGRKKMLEQHNPGKLSRMDAVVVAAVCLLLILLVPVLFARPREQAVRTLCAANLAQIGKAMFIYADNYGGALPRAGGPSTIWGGTPNWIASDRRAAFGLASDYTGGGASISSCFYLLVKYLQLSPRVFVCGGDKGTVAFRPAVRADGSLAFEFADVWDFGPLTEAVKHCSYTYHIPFGSFGLTTSRDPNLAVAADRSPWIISPAANPSIWQNFKPDIVGGGGVRLATGDQARIGNSISHRKDGQNVLFLDGRVRFEKRAYCGAEKDNIYSVSRDVTGHGDVWGLRPTLGAACAPAGKNDSVLVHDPDAFPSPVGPKER
jgi:hypothetical protein